MGNLFGQTNKTEQQSQQSSSSTNPLAGTVLQYGQSNVLPQFSSGNIASTAAGLGANQYQTGAANNQAALAQSAMPAFNSAANMAQNGISPSAIQQWMSPYTQNVINAYNAQADINDGRTLTQAQGSNALAGGLTNSAARGNMDYLRANLAANRNTQAANLYNTGYNTAASNAFQNAGLQNTAANTVSGMLGAQSGANATLGNLGQNLYGVSQYQAMLPYNLTTQGAQTLAGIVPGVGSSSTGTGSSTGTQTQSQGIGTIASGLLGSALMGGFNPFSMFSPKPAGGSAQGGSGMASGGSVFPRYEGNDQGTRLADTVNALRGMFRSSGGAIPRYDRGGSADWVSSGESAMPVFNGTTNVPASPASPFPAYSPPSDAMPSFAGASDRPSSGGMFGGLSSVLPRFDQGVWAGERATPGQRFGMALTQIGMNNPFAGFGKSAFDQSNLEQAQAQKERMQQAEFAQQSKIASGIGFNGAPTLDAQRVPAQIEHLKAQAALARTQGDKEFLLDLEKRKMQYAKELDIEQKRNLWNLIQEMEKDPRAQAQPSTRYKWSPQQ